MSGSEPDRGRPRSVLPAWAERLLAYLVPARNRDIVLGDFAELFQYIAETEGRGRALRWYAWQVIRSLPAFLSDGVYFGSVMFSNYLKVAVRNLTKRAFFSALNIGGLAVGMAACLLIFQYVAFEQSFDTFHRKGDDLYRVIPRMAQNGEARGTDPFTWSAMGPALAEGMPELAGYARVHPAYGTATIAYIDAAGERTAFREDNLLYVDSTFLSLFDFPLVRGDSVRALAEPGTILLSERAARKFFGDEDPMGQMLDVRAWFAGSFTVTGVFKDVPPHSHLQFDYLLPMADLLQSSQYRDTNGWSWSNFITYVHLRPDASVAEAERKIADVIYDRQREEYEANNTTVAASLQPLASIHLHSDLDGDYGVTGSAQTVYFFVLVALFVLIIAWVNYINLSTARALERAREVGVRKAAGARKGQVIAQFLLESGLTNLVALVLAVGLAAIGLPYLNDLAGVTVTASVWRSPWFWGSVVGVFGVGAVLASLYPAFILSTFHPADVLKGTLGTFSSRRALRKGLVVFQFAASIALLIGTYAVYSQVQFMRGQRLGMDVDRVLVVRRPSFVDEEASYTDLRETFKAELERHPAIASVATSAGVPGGGHNLGTRFRKEGTDGAESEPFHMVWVNDAFVDAYDMRLLAGRNLSLEMGADSAAVLLNETAVRTLGYTSADEAVNGRIVLGRTTVYTIVGVLEDFHWSSVKDPVQNFGLALTPGGGFYSMRVQTADVDQVLATVRDVYDEVFPGNPFTYHFADRFFDEQYRADQRFGTLFGAFALFALIVACLGLVGLAAYTAAQRTKEIGVRKVLGAGTWGIARLLLSDFTVLIGVAVLIATPVMYFVINAWLEGFAVRIGLHPGLFLVPGAVVLLMAWVTVSYHTVRVARADPVEALRYD